jgi:enoyl-CoA hydratase/carnithine racemase
MTDDATLGEAIGSEPAFLRVEGPVAILTLNRPAALNAADAALAQALRRLCHEVERRDDVRVLILRGAGTAFCAGGDIQAFARHLDDMDPLVRGLLGDLHEALLTLRRMPQLVLTSVHGAAAGAGLSLAFMGDMCIAADTARFTAAYHKLGVSPDGGSTIGVVEAVGARRAIQIFLAEGSFSAQQAHAWGLVNILVPAAALEAETMALAARIARTPPRAIAATKRLIHQSSRTPMAAQLEAEMEALLDCMRAPFFKDAVRAFVAR